MNSCYMYIVCIVHRCVYNKDEYYWNDGYFGNSNSHRNKSERFGTKPRALQRSLTVTRVYASFSLTVPVQVATYIRQSFVIDPTCLTTCFMPCLPTSSLISCIVPPLTLPVQIATYFVYIQTFRTTVATYRISDE